MAKRVSEVPPVAGRPKMPDGYGVPDHNQGLLPWSFVEERMAAALNYWVATVDGKGRPHSTPIWGAWVDGVCYFEGSPETKRGRNLARNPNVVVHLESGSEVVIIEGEAEEIRKPAPELAQKLVKSMGDKYGQPDGGGYRPEPNQWNEGGLYQVKPRVVFAWTKFPDDTTRWVF